MIKIKEAMILIYIALSVFICAPLFAEAAEERAETDIAGIKVLDLETAKRIALEKNPSHLAVRTRIGQALEQVKQARAAYFPTIDGQTSLTKNDFSESAFTQNGFSGNFGLTYQDDLYETSLTATLTLFDSFNRTKTLQSAKYGHKSSAEEVRDSRRQLLFSMAQSYYNVQNVIENISISKSSRDFNLRQLNDAKAKRAAGTGSLSDVLGFQVQVNSAESSLITAEKEYKIAMTGLAVLMGLPDASFPDGMELVPLKQAGGWMENPPVLADLIEAAVTSRPDIRQSDYSLKQADLNIGIARSGYYPTINLNGSYIGQREGNADYKINDFGNSIGVTVNLNLFSGGLTRAKVAEATAAKREARYALLNQTLSVKNEVISTLAEFNSAQKQLGLQIDNTRLTRQSRDLVEKEYKAGKSTIVKLNEAQNNLVIAQGKLIQARVDLHTAWEKINLVTARNLQ